MTWKHLLAPIVVVVANGAYSLWILRMNRKKAAQLTAELLLEAKRVRSFGPSHTLSLIALAMEGVIECTHKARSFVHLIPQLENPSGPHIEMLYYKYQPGIRDVRKDWTDAANSLSSHFPNIENAWRDWAAAYSDMTEPSCQENQEDALGTLDELMAAKSRFVSAASDVLSVVLLIES